MIPTPHQAAELIQAAYGAQIPKGWGKMADVWGRDALFGLQKLGLGERRKYGFVAVGNGCYVIVLRGTEGFHEWLEDAEVVPVPSPAGRVEAGFYSIYQSLEIDGAPLGAYGQSLTRFDQVVVMGHSLGAALAVYTLAEIPHGHGIFIACPHPGDEEYRSNYRQRSYQVFNYARDIVPDLPPEPFTSLAAVTALPADDTIPNDPVHNHVIATYLKLLEKVE